MDFWEVNAEAQKEWNFIFKLCLNMNEVYNSQKNQKMDFLKRLKLSQGD